MVSTTGLEESIYYFSELRRSDAYAGASKSYMSEANRNLESNEMLYSALNKSLLRNSIRIILLDDFLDGLSYKIALLMIKCVRMRG